VPQWGWLLGIWLILGGLLTWGFSRWKRYQKRLDAEEQAARDAARWDRGDSGQ
jgi:hypothetical protein